MKKVMFALCFMFGGVVAVTAQDAQDTTSNQYRTETQTGDQSLNQDSTQAQDPSQSQYAQGLDQDRERIQSTELPDEVKRSLEGQEYRGWLISGAYKAKGASDQSSMESDSTSTNPNQEATREDNANATGAQAEEVFIVELKNGAQTKTVRFDKNGEKIEGMDDESSQNQNNQYNQNEQMNEADQADPNAADPSSSQSTDETPDSQADQSTQSSESTDAPEDKSTETESTETESDQSSETQTDQSKANDPK